MGKEELLIMLYDYYGELFSIQQREYFEWYYFDNLSLAEIAENTGKSRNAIHKGIKSVCNKLYEYEDILKIYEKSNKLKVLGTDEDFNIVYNNESPIKFIKKGLSLVYPSENVGIRLDNTDKGSEIIYNYLKQGSEEIVRSIDEFYINGIVYYHRNERIKQRELRKSMKL